MAQIDYEQEHRTQEHWSQLELAAFDLVRKSRYQTKPDDDFQGLWKDAGTEPHYTLLIGSKAAAALTHRNAKNWANETNPNYAGAKAGALDLIKLEQAGNSTVFLQAHAHALGHLVWAPPKTLPADIDAALFVQFSNWQAKMGDTCNEIMAAVDPDGPAGGDINAAEAKAIIQKSFVHMEALMQLLERVANTAGIEQHFTELK